MLSKRLPGFARCTDFHFKRNNQRTSTQDIYRAGVFEKRYRDQFSCSTFSKGTFQACEKSSDGFVPGEVVEKAVIQYAKDNLAFVKVGIVFMNRRNIMDNRRSSCGIRSLSR